MQPNAPLQRPPAVVTEAIREKNMSYAVGDRVDGLYDGNPDDMWYPGRILVVHTDPLSYAVRYDDGEVEDHVDVRFLRRHVTGTVSVGTLVEGKYCGGDEWYRGKIIEIHDNGTYTIEYEDSEVETNVPLVHIREREEEEVTPAPEPSEPVAPARSEASEAPEASEPLAPERARTPPRMQSQPLETMNSSPNHRAVMEQQQQHHHQQQQQQQLRQQVYRQETLTSAVYDGGEMLDEYASIVESINLLEFRLNDAVATKHVLSTLVKQMRAFPQVTADLIHEKNGERLVLEVLKLHHSHAVIQCYGFVLLRRLCFLCAKSTHFFLRHDILGFITLAMKTFGDDAILQASACGALAVFTRVHAGIRLLLEHRVVHLVLTTLLFHKAYSVHTRQVHYYASEVLLELCELGDRTTIDALCGDVTSKINGAEIAPVSLLLFLLRQSLSYDDKKACCAVGTLLMCLAASHRQAALMILQLNGLPELSTVMAKYPTEPGIQKYSASASKEIALCSIQNSPTRKIKDTATEILQESSSLEELQMMKKSPMRTGPMPATARVSTSSSTSGSKRKPGSAYQVNVKKTSDPLAFTRFQSPLKHPAPPHFPTSLKSFPATQAPPQRNNLVILDGNYGQDQMYLQPTARPKAKQQYMKEERQQLLFETYGLHPDKLLAENDQIKTHGIKRTKLKTHLIAAEATCEEGAWAMKPQDAKPRSARAEVAHPVERPLQSSRDTRAGLFPSDQSDTGEDDVVHCGPRKKKTLTNRIRIEQTNDAELRVMKETFRSPVKKKKKIKAIKPPVDEAAALNALAAQLFHEEEEIKKQKDHVLSPQERERLSFAEKLHKMIDKAKSTLAHGTVTSAIMTTPSTEENTNGLSSRSNASSKSSRSATEAPVKQPKAMTSNKPTMSVVKTTRPVVPQEKKPAKTPVASTTTTTLAMQKRPVASTVKTSGPMTPGRATKAVATKPKETKPVEKKKLTAEATPAATPTETSAPVVTETTSLMVEEVAVNAEESVASEVAAVVETSSAAPKPTPSVEAATESIPSIEAAPEASEPVAPAPEEPLQPEPVQETAPPPEEPPATEKKAPQPEPTAEVASAPVPVEAPAPEAVAAAMDDLYADEYNDFDTEMDDLGDESMAPESAEKTDDDAAAMAALLGQVEEITTSRTNTPTLQTEEVALPAAPAAPEGTEAFASVSDSHEAPSTIDSPPEAEEPEAPVPMRLAPEAPAAEVRTEQEASQPLSATETDDPAPVEKEALETHESAAVDEYGDNRLEQTTARTEETKEPSELPPAEKADDLVQDRALTEGSGDEATAPEATEEPTEAMEAMEAMEAPAAEAIERLYDTELEATLVTEPAEAPSEKPLDHEPVEAEGGDYDAEFEVESARPPEEKQPEAPEEASTKEDEYAQYNDFDQEEKAPSVAEEESVIPSKPTEPIEPPVDANHKEQEHSAPVVDQLQEEIAPAPTPEEVSCENVEKEEQQPTEAMDSYEDDTAFENEEKPTEVMVPPNSPVHALVPDEPPVPNDLEDPYATEFEDTTARVDAEERVVEEASAKPMGGVEEAPASLETQEPVAVEEYGDDGFEQTTARSDQTKEAPTEPIETAPADDYLHYPELEEGGGDEAMAPQEPTEPIETPSTEAESEAPVETPAPDTERLYDAEFEDPAEPAAAVEAEVPSEKPLDHQEPAEYDAEFEVESARVPPQEEADEPSSQPEEAPPPSSVESFAEETSPPLEDGAVQEHQAPQPAHEILEATVTSGEEDAYLMHAEAPSDQSEPTELVVTTAVEPQQLIVLAEPTEASGETQSTDPTEPVELTAHERTTELMVTTESPTEAMESHEPTPSTDVTEVVRSQEAATEETGQSHEPTEPEAIETKNKSLEGTTVSDSSDSKGPTEAKASDEDQDFESQYYQEDEQEPPQAAADASSPPSADDDYLEEAFGEPETDAPKAPEPSKPQELPAIVLPSPRTSEDEYADDTMEENEPARAPSAAQLIVSPRPEDDYANDDEAFEPASEGPSIVIASPRVDYEDDYAQEDFAEPPNSSRVEQTKSSAPSVASSAPVSSDPASPATPDDDYEDDTNEFESAPKPVPKPVPAAAASSPRADEYEAEDDFEEDEPKPAAKTTATAKPPADDENEYEAEYDDFED